MRRYFLAWFKALSILNQSHKPSLHAVYVREDGRIYMRTVDEPLNVLDEHGYPRVGWHEKVKKTMPFTFYEWQERMTLAEIKPPDWELVDYSMETEQVPSDATR